MLLQRLVDEKSNAHVIDKLTLQTSAKPFRDEVYGSEIIAIYGDFYFVREQNSGIFCHGVHYVVLLVLCRDNGA